MGDPRACFCTSSVGRNPFLQGPAGGLFGGDTAWALSAYAPNHAPYRDSAAYRATVVTASGDRQRAPLACWYALGTGTARRVTRDASAGTTVLWLAWSVSAVLWDAVRLPGQVVTLCDDGGLVHAALGVESTPALAVLVWTSASAVTLAAGDAVPYMIRRVAPRNAILGPVEAVDDAGREIAVEVASPAELPLAAQHLVYLGGRTNAGARACGLTAAVGDPRAARDAVCAVEEVRPLRTTGPAVRPRAAPAPAATDWFSPTPAVDLLVLRWSAPLPALSGVECAWPYAADETAVAGVLVPVFGGVGAPGPIAAPDDVRFVVDDAPRRASGDHYLVTDAAGDPLHVAEWPSGGVVFVPSTTADVLIVGERTAWMGRGGGSWTRYAVAAPLGVVRGPRVDLRCAPPIATTWQAVVLFARRPDELSPTTPQSLDSNALRTLTPADAASDWTFPPSADDVFVPAAATDGLIGLPLRRDPLSGVDYAFVRRRMEIRPAGDSRGPECLRINLDMGAAVPLSGLTWALVSDGARPTISLWGNNNPNFFTNWTVQADIQPGNEFATHVLPGGQCIWRAGFDGPGSAWTADDVANGTADVFLTRFLSGSPSHTRLFTDGRVVPAAAGAPPPPLVAPAVYSVTTPPTAYRYYAFVLSAGTVGTEARVELQQLQPMRAPDPAPSAPTAVAFERPAALPAGHAVYALRLSRAVPPAAADAVGYVEVWDRFRTWVPYHQGQAWAPGSFAGAGATIHATATVTLSEVIVPRYAAVRALGVPITSVPYLWCLVRHRALEPVGHHVVVAPRVIDSDGASPVRSAPAWTGDRAVFHFQLPVSSARISGEARFISLAGNQTIRAVAVDVVTASLPEFCLLLPSGQVLDLAQYDDNAPLPAEVPPDETAGVTASLLVEIGEAADGSRSKRARADGR